MRTYPKQPGSTSPDSSKACRKRSSNSSNPPAEAGGALRELDQHQVELGLAVVYAVLQSEESHGVLDVPPSLQHLQDKDWEALASALYVLMRQRERNPLH